MRSTEIATQSAVLEKSRIAVKKYGWMDGSVERRIFCGESYSHFAVSFVYCEHIEEIFEWVYFLPMNRILCRVFSPFRHPRPQWQSWGFIRRSMTDEIESNHILNLANAMLHVVTHWLMAMISCVQAAMWCHVIIHYLKCDQKNFRSCADYRLVCDIEP